MLIENFRPGTLERWGLGPDALLAANPRLVVARVTAFGQHGPYATRPGFGSIAEAMSGFAALTGEPDGPADAAAVRARRRHRRAGDELRRDRSAAQRRRRRGTRPGRRRGHHRADPDAARRPDHRRSTSSASCSSGSATARSTTPRATCTAPADGEWVAVSTSSQSIAERVMRLVGRPDLVERAVVRHRAPAGRSTPTSSTTPSAAWIAARPTAAVLAAFEAAEAAVGPVYDVRGVMADPQYAALGTVQTVDDDELGPVKMQNVLFRLSETPGVDPLGRPPPRRRHRRGARASSASTPTSSPTCVQKGVV